MNTKTTTTTEAFTPWNFTTAVRSMLTLDGMDEDKAQQLLLPMLSTMRRYVEQTRALRMTYTRIASSAERAVFNIDAGYAIHENDELGSDRDRLVQLHQQIATLRDQIFNIRATVQALDIEIDPFDYLNQ